MSSQVAARRRKLRTAKPPASLREARDAMYRKHVIEVAERVFADHGEAGTKMQDVAAAASISLGTLYAAFPSKTDLYQAIVAARGDELLARVMDSVDTLRSEGVTTLVMMLRAMSTNLRFFMEHPAFLKMSLLEGHAWYHSASRPSREQEDHWTRGARLLDAGFTVGQQEGLFVPDVPAAQGRTTVALQQTRLANWVLMGMSETHDELVASVQAEFVRAFCRPAVAMQMLIEDGSRLRPDALTMMALRPPPQLRRERT